MSLLSRISIKSKLLLMLLGVSLTSVLLIGFLALRTAEDSLESSIRAQLTSTRALKNDQILTYYTGFAGLTRTLAESSGVINAASSFGLAYREGSEQQLTPDQHQQLTDYYEQDFLPELEKTGTEAPLTVLYRPRTPAANYFQYHYIAENPYPYDEKSALVVAESDVTTYKRVHETSHPSFVRMRNEFNFGDLYLIDIETGNIVYSVNKGPDFGTNLYEGPYRNSGLGALAQRIRAEPERGLLQSVDYRPYPPAFNAPTAFFGLPLFSDNKAVGILAIQLPSAQIDAVMTGDGNWRDDGLGETGESYLVGPDLMMRSVSRFFVEDKDAYLETAAARGMQQQTIDAMSHHSTVSLQPVDTEAARRALAGEAGTDITRDYRGVEVLSSYAPITLGGDPWAIITQVDLAEAYRPIRDLQRTILVWTVGLMLGVAFLAVVLAQFFVRPIDRLIAAAKRIAGGEDEVHVEITSDDEFGDLGRNFNSMADSIHRQKAAIAEKNAENERLLLNILPASVAARLQAGERIADQLQQVSVVFIHMLGFTELSEKWSAVESATLLEQLLDRLDEAAARRDVERVKTVGETYIAACGLTSPRLDHAARCVDFAVDALKIMRYLDRETEQALALQIGVNAGPVISGVVGTNRFNFELWGETVEIASRVHLQAAPQSLLITQTVYERIENQGAFRLHSEVASFSAAIPVYEYVGNHADGDGETEELP